MPAAVAGLIRALIVDDEPIARAVLREELDAVEDIEVVAEAADGVEALARIASHEPDLVFLDLQMPGMGGFDVVRELRGALPPAVVIVTAFDQHAVEAFETGAVDYLLKPVSQARLTHCLQRVRPWMASQDQSAAKMAQLLKLASAVPAASGARKIVGRAGQEYFLLSTDEVLAFQADGDLVWIITARQKYLATQTLRSLQERLAGSTFQRVHRNALVNVNHVRKMSSLTSQRWLLTLINGQEFIVSKRQAKLVRELLED
jgi:DNA-binding LytR/AlgR family response regulator